MYTVTKFPHGTFSWADLTSTDVPQLGGKVHTPIIETGPMRFAVVSDPTGAVFTPLQTDAIDPWLEHQA